MKLEKNVKEDKKENITLDLKALEIRMAEAIAWTKKYFKAASELREDLFDMSNPSKAKRFISSPIQAINQEEADIASIEPKNRINKNKIFHGRISIKRRIIPYLGYEPKSFILAYSFIFWCKSTESFDLSGINSS